MLQRLFTIYWQNAFFIAFAFILFLYFYEQKWFKDHIPLANPPQKQERKTYILSIIVLFIAMCHFTVYILAPNYADYGEPVIPILAANFLKGGKVYADWNSGKEMLGSNYGPYTFIVQAAAITCWPNLVASKMVGIIAASIGLTALFLALRRQMPSSLSVLPFCALAVAAFSFNLHYWFWNRPDSMLIALVSIAALLFDCLTPGIGLIALGMLAGLALNLKLFGAFYLLPFAVAYIVTVPWPRLILSSAIGGVLFSVIVLLPFLSASVDAGPYVNNLLLMRSQGFVVSSVPASLAYGAVILFAPLVVVRKLMLNRTEVALLAALPLCMLIIAVLSAKPGGGSPYMLPFIPLSMYLTCRLCARLPLGAVSQVARAHTAVLVGTLICVSPIWAYSFYQISKQFSDFSIEADKTAELRRLFLAYPKAEMAHGNGPTMSSDEFFRVQKAFLGQVTRFDYVNYADQRLARVSISVLYPMFENCRIPVWILARTSGVFDGTVYGPPLFDDHIRDLFQRNYEVAEGGQFFSVWKCRVPPSQLISN